MDGKDIRMNRILHNGKMLCVPLDHGITMSNIGQLERFDEIMPVLVNGGASAVIIHKGMARFLPNMHTTGLIIHLSASTSDIIPVHKVIVCGVEEAVSLGADAVSVHVNLCNRFEKQMLSDLSMVSKDCKKFGIPLLAMMYIRDDNNNECATLESVKHSIRIAAELGADIVKIGAGLGAQLKSVVDSALVPIVVAGGDLVSNTESILGQAKEIMKSGALGVSFGRNIFMSNNPAKMMEELSQVVYH